MDVYGTALSTRHELFNSIHVTFMITQASIYILFQTLFGLCFCNFYMQVLWIYEWKVTCLSLHRFPYLQEIARTIRIQSWLSFAFNILKLFFLKYKIYWAVSIYQWMFCQERILQMERSVIHWEHHLSGWEKKIFIPMT